MLKKSTWENLQIHVKFMLVITALLCHFTLVNHNRVPYIILLMYSLYLLSKKMYSSSVYLRSIQ